MANVSLQPTAGGPSTEELIAAVGDGIYIIGDKSWSIDMQRYNFQFTGQRFYRVRDGRLAGQLRDVAYQGTTTEFWGAMQATGGEPTYVLGGAFNCGKGSRARWRRSATAPGGPLPTGAGAERRRGIRPVSGRVDHGASAGPRPQELVERALDLSQAEACVVIGEAVSDANLRWANNTLTTNGLTRSNQLTVIAVSGGAVGVVSRSGVTLDSLESLVRAAEKTARTSPEAEDVAPLVAGDTPGGGWDDPPATTGARVFTRFAAELGEAFARASGAGELLFGYAEHELRTTYVASSTGLRARHDEPTGHVEINAKSADFGRSAWAGVATADFADVDVEPVTADLSRRLSWAAGGWTCRPGAIRPSCRRVPWRT